MVETQDSSVLAQLGWPAMRLPILYTMSWPDRICCSEITWPRLDLCKLGSLTFRAPDNVKYPSVDLAHAVGRAGGTMTGVLSAANEKAVEMFIDEMCVLSTISRPLRLQIQPFWAIHCLEAFLGEAWVLHKRKEA